MNRVTALGHRWLRLLGMHSEPVDVRTALPESEVYRTVNALPPREAGAGLYVQVLPAGDDVYRVVGAIRPSRIWQVWAFLLPMYVLQALTHVADAVRRARPATFFRIGIDLVLVGCIGLILFRSRDRSAARAAVERLVAAGR